MQRLIIHPGSPKTGTSSIQAFLNANREALAREGFALMTPHDLRRTPFMAEVRNAVHWRGVKKFDHGAFAGPDAGDAHTLVISEEGFCAAFLPGAQDFPKGVAGADRSAAIIAGLPFEEKRVVWTVRGQAGLVRSAYIHKVKLHRETRTFEKWLARSVDADALSWTAAADIFENAGVGVSAAVPFELLKAEELPAYLLAFSEAAGLPTDALDFSSARADNLSANPLAVSVMRRLNHIPLSVNRSKRRNARIARKLKKYKGGDVVRDPAALEAISVRYREENRAFAERYFPQWRDLFAPDPT